MARITVVRPTRVPAVIRGTLAAACLVAVAPALSSLQAPLGAQDSAVRVANIARGTVDRNAPTPIPGTAKLTEVERDRLMVRTERANRLFEDGAVSEAANLLRDVVKQERKAGGYPREAMRRLAQAEYALDRPVAAAQVLEDLAALARDWSDPATEFDALVDASVLHQQLGNATKRQVLAFRIRHLMQSPAVPEASKVRVMGSSVPF